MGKKNVQEKNKELSSSKVKPLLHSERIKRSGL